MKRTKCVHPKTFKKTADAIAQAMGWKDHEDACKHKGPDGKVGYGTNHPKYVKAKNGSRYQLLPNLL